MTTNDVPGRGTSSLIHRARSMYADLGNQLFRPGPLNDVALYLQFSP